MGVVQIYYADHAPPHFHVQYAGETAKFEIETLALIDGSLPARARGLVTGKRVSVHFLSYLQ